MQKELLELKKQLNAILSSDATLKKALREVNKMDMIKASMIVRNPKHQEVLVDRILDGELIRDISIGDYIFVRNYAELVKAAYNNLEMGNSMDRNMLISAYRILSENPQGDFVTTIRWYIPSTMCRPTARMLTKDSAKLCEEFTVRICLTMLSHGQCICITAL